MIEVAQSCPSLCDPMDYSLPGSSINGTFQAIVLEWVAISFSKGPSLTCAVRPFWLLCWEGCVGIRDGGCVASRRCKSRRLALGLCSEGEARGHLLSLEEEPRDLVMQWPCGPEEREE